MPSTKDIDSRRPYICARNRRLTTCVPWDARGDFVVASLKGWAEENDSNVSSLMMEALEWYFTNNVPKWFYDKISETIEAEEFKRLHHPDSGGFCHRLSCESCYSKRSAHYAETAASIRAKSRGD